MYSIKEGSSCCTQEKTYLWYKFREAVQYAGTLGFL